MMRNGIAIGLLMFLLILGCTTPQQQTMLGQEGSRGLFGARTQRAAMTRTQIIENPTYKFNPDDGLTNDPSLVRDVLIIGNEQVLAKDILKIVKTIRGRPFNEAMLEEDKRALMQKGWFIDVKPKVERTPVGYVVTFQFFERQLIRYVKINGNKAHTKKILQEEANIKAGDAQDPIAIYQAKERMEQFYRESGYFNANIEVLSGDQPGDRGVVFRISEGVKQRILKVEFEGNQVASSARLKTQIQSKPGWFFWINSEFNPKMLSEDVETLTTYYRKLGFFYAKIDRKFVETEGYTGRGQNRAWVKVKYIIDEGPRCRVGDIRFVGQKVYKPELLKSLMKLPKEKYFNQDMLEVDMARIKEKYGEIGFVFAQAVPDPRIDEDYVDIVINVKEGPRCYLNSLKVEIVGNEGGDPYTKLQPILNRMSLRPGDVLSTKEINASKRRLIASQLFNANPTQGAMPDIIFNYPIEAREDEEREALASADSQIRGQVGRGQAGSPHRPYLALTSNGDLQVKMDGDWDEEDVEAFTTYFQVQMPQAPTQQHSAPQFQSQSGPAQPYPARSYPATQNLAPHEPMQQSPASLPYRAIQPVEPMLLNWTPSDGTETVRSPVEDVLYRGQSRPSGASIDIDRILRQNQQLVQQQSQQQSWVAQQPAVVQPAYLGQVDNQYGSIVQVSTYGSQQSLQQGGSLQAIPYPVSSTPAQIQYPQSDGSYGTLGNQALMSDTTTTALYTPPTDISKLNGVNGMAYPTNHLSPQGGQQVGGAALYNQGPLFAQTGAPGGAVPNTATVLGNVVDDAIANSAYGFDPNSPYGKTYPTDGVIRVQETRTGQLMMSVAVSSDSGLVGRFVIEEQNFDILRLPQGFGCKYWKDAFRGNGERFRIEAVPGTDVQRYSVSWETPHLLDHDYTLGVSGFYYQRYYDEWYEDRIGGSVSIGKLWTQDFSTRLVLGGQQVRIYNPVYPAPADLASAVGHHPMYTIGLEASYDTRDSTFMPTEGISISGGVEQVFGDYRFVRGNVDVRKYFTLHERPDRSGRWVLGLRSSLSVSETGTPIYERYFGGGYSNLRGFDYRSVSPRSSYGVVEGGCMEFYNSAELIFPITADDMVRGSLFVDSGTVERSVKNWDSKYRVAVGFGLRLTIPMMGPAPIALDFAFPLSKEEGDERQVFSFNVGFMR